jgi:outer membrane lipoprotein carrier protein
MNRIVVALALLVFVCMPAARAAEGARAQLEAFAHDLHSVTADFQQTLTDANGQRGNTSSGTLALMAPRELRWQTDTPYKQLIVADGSRVWMYDPDLEQVTVRRQSTAESHSPLTVLTDMSQLDHEFKVTDIGERDGLQWLRLTARNSNAQFDYAELGFAGNALQRMVFRDQLGNLSTIRFSHWKRNPTLPASTFNFTPPKGADVVGDVQGVPEIRPLGQ